MPLSHFDEKSGIIACKTDWGQWWQTVDEVNIEICVPDNTRSKNLVVDITPTTVYCRLYNKDLLQGKLYRVIHPDDSIWTLEDNRVVRILLSKACHKEAESVWPSLFEDGSYCADPVTFNEMRKKLDLEKFQIENPGMDFSQAKLQKCYDTMPGLPSDVI